MKKVFFLLSCSVIGSLYSMRMMPKLLPTYKQGIVLNMVANGPYKNRIPLIFGICRKNFNSVLGALEKPESLPTKKLFLTFNEYAHKYQKIHKENPAYEKGRLLWCNFAFADDDRIFRGWIGGCSENNQLFDILVNSHDLVSNDQKEIEKLIDQGELKELYELD